MYIKYSQLGSDNLAKVKCLICGNLFDKDKESNIKVSNRYVHEKCFYETEQGHLLQLEKYIKSIMSLDKITPLIKRQIQRFHEENKYSYNGIFLTLKYFYEIKNGDPHKARGIGIVEYVYDDAKNYYEQLQKVAKNIDNTTLTKDLTRVFTIISPLRKNKKQKIDLSQLEGE